MLGGNRKKKKKKVVGPLLLMVQKRAKGGFSSAKGRSGAVCPVHETLRPIGARAHDKRGKSTVGIPVWQDLAHEQHK
jgi:hypothetical protein